METWTAHKVHFQMPGAMQIGAEPCAGLLSDNSSSEEVLYFEGSDYSTVHVSGTYFFVREMLTWATTNQGPQFSCGQARVPRRVPMGGESNAKNEACVSACVTL